LAAAWGGAGAIAAHGGSGGAGAGGAPRTNDDEAMRKLQIEREKKRFAAIRQDAAKLLEVATELKQYVDKTGKDVLSLEVMRKAEEMEKLARQIKNNMRGE
jgi:nicotinic acid phosphoribosyltransferase